MNTPGPVSDSSPVTPTAQTEVTEAKSLSQWFTTEVHPHDGQLKAYLRGSYPSVRDVDDVVQESYLRLWKAKSVRSIASVRAFLYAIARHVAIDHVRREKISPFEAVGDLDSLPVLDSGPTAAELLTQQERLSLLAKAIVDLPDRMREIIILHKVDRLSQAEVAAQLGIAEKTVANLCLRGMTRCREYLRRHGYENE